MRVTAAILIGCLSSACAIGMDTNEFRPARSPQGVRSKVTTANGPFTGELIEVRDTAVILLADEKASATPGAVTQRLRLIPFTAVTRADFEQLGSGVRLTNGRPPTADARARLRLLSRFPYGMPAGVEGALLKAYGQDTFGGVDR